VIHLRFAAAIVIVLTVTLLGSSQVTGHSIAMGESGSAYATGYASFTDSPTATPTPGPLPDKFLFAIGAQAPVGQFNYPYGVAVAPDGTVYVADTWNHRIQRFSATGQFLGTWGSQGSGDGQFVNPYSVTVAPDGTVYVADTDNDRIQRFSATGQFLGKWGSSGSGDGQFREPYGVAVASGGTVYVADSGNNRIQRFSATGQFLGKWGPWGSGDGQFDYPYGVAVAPDGTVYVADTGNHRIQRFSATGQFLGKWGSQGNGDGQFNYPCGVAVAPDGTVYVADSENYRIQRFSVTGQLLGKWGSVGIGDGQFWAPEGVAVAPDGTVYVADTWNPRIQRFSATGQFLGKWGSQGSGDGQFDHPSDVAVASDGTVYVADTWNHRIQRFSATGQFLGKWGSQGSGDGQFDHPSGVAVAPDGTVYVADMYNHRIQAFGPAYPTTWRGEYFANRWLAERPVLIRDEAGVNFTWGIGSPGVDVPADNFSARCQRYDSFDAGTYRFTVFADDGVRLWVDDRLLIDQWQDQVATYSADISLTQGYHRVRLEYFEAGGDAVVRLSWELAPDEHEDDDSCARASAIPTDGSHQTHTFHDAGDQDWVRFTAVSGKTYIIETSNVGPRSDAVLFLYDTCEAPPLAAEDNAFAPTVRLEWDATRSGTYYLKLQQHDPSIYGDDTYYDLSVTVDTVPPSPPPSLRAAPANQALVIQWRRSPERDVAGYHVWFGTTPGVYSGVERVIGADVTFYELTGLENGTRYYIAVSSFDFSDNRSDRSLEISAIPTPPPDQTTPSVTVNQPTAAAVFTTTLSAVTIGGSAQDQGGNLSRVQVRNITRGIEGWDYSLQGTSREFRVENVSLGVGDNQIQITAYDDAGNTGNASLTIHRLGESLGAAIIVAGHDNDNLYQVNINNAANRAYQVFQGAGFDDDHIYYLAPTPQDPDGDGVYDEFDGWATVDNVRDAIQTWASQNGRVGPGRPLYLYLIDHGDITGGIEYFCTDGCKSSGRITPRDLDTWLSALETSTSVNEVNVIIEACRSGSFIDRLGDLRDSISKPGRVIITSTDRDHSAYASAQGAYFSDAFFSRIAAGNDLKTCFNEAKAAVAKSSYNQIPWLDDNGDGLSNTSDGTIAQNRYVARFFGASAPEIVDAGVTVKDGSGVLTARVEAGAEEIELVWAAVYAPSFQEPTVTTLELGVPLLRLTADPDVEGLYRVTYPGGFTEEGTYRVVFYAQDRMGMQAQPTLVIAGGHKLYLPLVQRRNP
jgi:sugar lactone lactonase YvrE